MITQYLKQAGGKIAYDVQGNGPLVICAPGLGDIRSEYRFLVPALVKAGYRVATVDLRGHGESSVSWTDMSIAAHGEDLLALIRELAGAPATLIGTSFSASSVLWAAIEQPEQVHSTVIIGPFVRDTMPAWMVKAIFPLLFRGPWGVAAWKKFYGTLYPVHKPADYPAYLETLTRSFKQPGRMRALRQLITTSKARLTERLGELNRPTLVVMGEQDPDFKQPAQEAAWIAERTNATVAIIPEAGHYPHVDRAEHTATEIIDYLKHLGASKAYGA